MNSSWYRKIALVVSFLGLGAAAFSVSTLRQILAEAGGESEAHASRHVASVEPPESGELNHGKPAGHGATAAPSDAEGAKATSHFNLEEILVNISEGSAKGSRTAIHTLGLKIDLELFSDDLRSSIEKNQPALRNTIIEVANNQELEKLNTLAGKLYFKELLVSRMNAQLKQVAVRDLHFSTFFLK